MPAWTWVTHHRLMTAGVTVFTLLAAVAAGIWFFTLRSPGTPLDLRQALRLYRTVANRSSAVAADGETDLPPPGVYRYRTSGGEKLSFGGIARSFPDATEMIVTDRSCATVQWEPLRQHVEGMVLCQHRGALELTSTNSFEQIAGSTDTTVIDCPAGTYLLPPRPRPGERWATVCWSGHQRVTASGQVLGAATVAVGHQQVPALHVRLTLHFAGNEVGANPNDFWLAPDGLILRQKEEVDLAQQAGPLGTVHYSEQMAVTLESLQPMT